MPHMPPLITRVFPGELTDIYERARPDGGPPITAAKVRIVPYGQPTEVADRFGDRLVRYREQFAPGSFDMAKAKPGSVPFIFGHHDQPRLGDTLGRGLSFTDSPLGCEAEFSLHQRNDVDVQALLEDYGGVSVSFMSIRPAGGREQPNTLVTRTQVALRHVALVPEGAYPGAKVLSYRDPGEAVVDLAQAAAEAEERAAVVKQLVMIREVAGWRGEDLPAEMVAYRQAHQAVWDDLEAKGWPAVDDVLTVPAQADPVTPASEPTGPTGPASG